MASAPHAGGGAGGDGSRNRWSDSKVYSRKSHTKKFRPSPAPPAADDAASSLHQPPPPPLPTSDDASSSLTRPHRRTVTLNLSPNSPHEARSLRRRLTSELEQVRSVSRKLETRQIQLSSAAAHTHSQLSVSDPAPSKKSDEKRTPKANQYYRNSDFILGKDKIPKPKANGSKKHASVNADFSTDTKLSIQAFKNCGVLLSKLMKNKFGWVFNKPVDVKGLGLHDYLTIIKRPMDLGTVKSRLTNNWYKSPGEFAEDVRLTFRNAMTYNAKGQDVYVMAEQLLQLFEEGWPAIESEYTYSKPKSPQIDVRTLERSDSTAHPVAVDRKTAPVNHVTRPPGTKKPKARELHKRDMSFEEKQKLSNNLQNLPSEKLDNIVQIIKKRNLMMTQHDNEIEVDIDNVDNETLWELDRFVTNYRKSLSKNRKKAELAVQARAELEPDVTEKTAESIQEPVALGVSKEDNAAVEEKMRAASSQVGGEREENEHRSNNSSSSSSLSGSSSSESGSDSSSASESDMGHSPKT